MEEKDFTERGFYKFSNYLWWFLISNFCFVITNLPLIIFVILYPALSTGMIQIGLSIGLIFTAPAAAALFSTMGKLVRDKDLNAVKDFFKAYKTNFMQSIFIGALQVLILNVLYIDTIYFRSSSLSLLSYIFYFLFIYIIALSTFIFPILSRFYLKTKDIFILSVMYSIKKIFFTVANLLIMIMVGVLIINVSSVVIFFIFSIGAFIMMLWQNKVLEDIEEKLKKEEE